MNKFDGVKIALGYEIREGPWGGGNQFLIAFKKYFSEKGAKIVHKLEDNLNIIIIINPTTGSFLIEEIEAYKRKNQKVKIIHRINESDKAKNSNHIVRQRLDASKSADVVIFISEWLKQYYINNGFNQKIPHIVIRNSPDRRIFNPDGYGRWYEGIPMKIVTHHWSDNPMKGGDIYQYFDELLADRKLREQFKFTYIGNKPRGVKFKNTKYIASLYGQKLARELKKHHVYLTAARWEACGMHQLEAACCGLPILYINEGGGVVETCKDFGIKYDKSSFLSALNEIRAQYQTYLLRLKDFPYDESEMNRKYEDIIVKLLSKKEHLNGNVSI